MGAKKRRKLVTETMTVAFPGGKRVTSTYKGFSVHTDQPQDEGGEGSAPEPYDLLLSSIGTCAGVYVLYFCHERNIDTGSLALSLTAEKDERTHLFRRIDIRVHLPPGFPEKYTAAVARAAQQCTVKRSLTAPPEITVTAVTSAA
jgi:ribosomal protein S12 methylthiotransferase accessory factor